MDCSDLIQTVIVNQSEPTINLKSGSKCLCGSHNHLLVILIKRGCGIALGCYGNN